MARQSSALSEALRAWRARTTPAAAGLPARADRRVPGLRREELAGLAGLSVDYLVRLEQGRPTTFEVGPRVSAHKTVQYPDVGPLALDCEVLAVAGCDLKMVVYTAEPNTADAANLELLRVLGVQHLAD